MGMPKKVKLTLGSNDGPVLDFHHAQRFLIAMYEAGKAHNITIQSLNGVNYDFKYPDIVRSRQDKEDTNKQE